MGCNSHLAIEYQFVKDWWRPYALDVAERRDYRMYSAMAGVRHCGEIVPVSEPKGLPEDIEEDTAEYIKDHADHSFTWLTPAEFFEAYKRAGEPEPAKEWRVLKATLESLVSEFGDKAVRLIVGFDN